ncbi:hypothetical protein ACWGLL_00390 [Brevundimonas sp. NPDC055814]
MRTTTGVKAAFRPARAVCAAADGRVDPADDAGQAGLTNATLDPPRRVAARRGAARRGAAGWRTIAAMELKAQIQIKKRGVIR